MTNDPSQVIVTTADHPLRKFPGPAVYHRNFPEVRGEGGSPEDAAARLVELMSRTLDSAPNDWRRVNLDCAVEDVRVFVNR